MSTGVGITSDMRIAAFIDQLTFTPGCHGVPFVMRPRAATSGSLQVNKRYPEQWVTPLQDRAQQRRTHDNVTTKDSASLSPAPTSASQEDIAFFLRFNNRCSRYVLGKVCTRASVSLCRCSHLDCCVEGRRTGNAECGYQRC